MSTPILVMTTSPPPLTAMIKYESRITPQFSNTRNEARFVREGMEGYSTDVEKTVVGRLYEQLHYGFSR